MNIYEDFVRCPSCEHPYFKKEILYTVNKHAFEEKSEKVLAKESVVRYTCEKCGQILI